MERWSTTVTSLPTSLHYWTSQRQLFVYVMQTCRHAHKKELKNSNIKPAGDRLGSSLQTGKSKSRLYIADSLVPFQELPITTERPFSV